MLIGVNSPIRGNLTGLGGSSPPSDTNHNANCAGQACLDPQSSFPGFVSEPQLQLPVDLSLVRSISRCQRLPNFAQPVDKCPDLVLGHPPSLGRGSRACQCLGAAGLDLGHPPGHQLRVCARFQSRGGGRACGRTPGPAGPPPASPDRRRRQVGLGGARRWFRSAGAGRSRCPATCPAGRAGHAQPGTRCGGARLCWPNRTRWGSGTGRTGAPCSTVPASAACTTRSAPARATRSGDGSGAALAWFGPPLGRP